MTSQTSYSPIICSFFKHCFCVFMWTVVNAYFVNDDVIDFMLIIHSPLFWRLDRLKRSVDQCGRKTFYAFTKRKRIRVDGALELRSTDSL